MARPAAEPAKYCTGTWVTSAAYAIFYASAIAASIGAGLFLTRIVRLRYGWLTLLLALLVGTIFGLLMFGRFLTLRSVPERWEMAPPGNPYGTPIGCLDLVVPWLITAAHPSRPAAAGARC